MIFLVSMPGGGEWLWISLMLMFGIGLIPYIFYLLTLQKTLALIPPPLRQLRPGQVWLMFIPFFNLAWQFVIVKRMAGSIAAAFRTAGLPLTEPPGHKVGLAYCICICACWVPLLGSLATLAGLVLWVLHWMKMAECKSRLQMLQAAFLNDNQSVFRNV